MERSVGKHTAGKQKCCGSIHLGRQGMFMCYRGGSVQEGGKWYCRIHAPSIAKARQAARDAKRNAEDKARDKRDARAQSEAAELSHRASCFGGPLAACEAALETLNKAAITKATKKG